MGAMMDDNEFEAYTRDAVRELQQKIESMHVKYNFNSIARWECDLKHEPAELRYFDSTDRLALICDIIEIGTFSPPTLSWQWAWSNASLTPKLRERALPLKQLQQITGRDYFGSENPVSADWDFAWQLAATSVKHLSALGCYEARLQDGRLYAFLAILRIHAAENGEKRENP
jgi:hypothetical protein